METWTFAIIDLAMADQVCLHRVARQTQVVEHYTTLMLTLCVLNFICSFVASVGNLFVIYALWKVSSIPSNLKNLFLSLAFSDLAVGLFAQPIHGAITAVMLMKVANENFNFTFLCPAVMIVSHVSGYLLAVATFLNITAIAIDRLLVLSLHLRYLELVTPKRIVITLVSLWFTSAVATSLYMTCPKQNSVVTVVLECVGLILTAVANIRIYQAVRYHQDQIRNQLQQGYDEARQRLRERKSSISALYVFVIFVACYIPNLCAAVLLMADLSQISFRAIYNVTASLVLLNSSLNPIVYCWRFREMRAILKGVVRNISPTNGCGQ